ncbi:type 11 methyltransferase [Ignicoccus pacificus DSM 13166]|uniref:Type 11 methyltransferase n=1 Tax=Ignicoccus pacificus DSM 13166 TaxID=940294 RepID=A0A977PKK3_9CREN|nr:type 11 methyltransferase [Ignicoccus pacificus DSM 13166]
MGGGCKGLEVARYYDAIARGYDELYGEEQERKYYVGLKILPPKERVLDAGCGTALLSEHVEGYYLGIDISIEMLKIGKEKIRGETKDLVLGDVQLLPLRSKSFATCYSFTVLQNVEDPHKALEELRRCCSSCVVSSLKGKGLEDGDCLEVYPDVLCKI